MMKLLLTTLASLFLATSYSHALNVMTVTIIDSRTFALTAENNNASKSFTDDGTVELNVFIPGQELATTSATLSNNSLTAGTNNAVLTSAYIEHFSNGYTNLFLSFDSGPIFSTSSQPFNGTVVLSFAESSPADGNLPAPGASNDIIESFTEFTVVGEYNVVPEPGAYATVLALVIGLFAFYKRQKKPQGRG